jgi:hypothetical protein
MRISAVCTDTSVVDHRASDWIPQPGRVERRVDQCDQSKPCTVSAHPGASSALTKLRANATEIMRLRDSANSVAPPPPHALRHCTRGPFSRFGSSSSGASPRTVPPPTLNPFFFELLLKPAHGSHSREAAGGGWHQGPNNFSVPLEQSFCLGKGADGMMDMRVCWSYITGCRVHAVLQKSGPDLKRLHVRAGQAGQEALAGSACER